MSPTVMAVPMTTQGWSGTSDHAKNNRITEIIVRKRPPRKSTAVMVQSFCRVG